MQKAQYLDHEPGDPFYSSNQYKTSIGADFKIGIGSNLNLDGTINPDFGQVEVDPAVVNLSAFETFFPERRPFFIEGSNIMLFGFGGANNNWGFNFQTPELFYSRRIGRAPQGWVDADYDYIDYPTETRILGAAKLTGKIDESWSLGLLSSTTERTYTAYEYDGERYEQEVEPLTHYGVARTQKTFNDGKQGLGMIFTSVNRDVSDSIMSKQLVNQAYTFGVDGWTFLDEDETYVITGNFIGSYFSGSQESVTIKQVQSYRYAQRPDATYAPLDTTLTSMGGWFSRFMLNKQKGNFRLNAAIGAVSPGFENNDLGFQWNADKINGHVVLGYRWFEPDKIFRRKFFDIAHFRSYDFEGDNMNNGIMLFSHLQFVNYYNLGFRGGYALQTISRTLTRGGPKAANPSEYWFDLDLSTDNRENVVLGIDGHYSEDEIGGIAYRVGLGVEWKPFSQINFSVGPEYSRNKNMIQWVGNFEDPYATETYEHRYVFGKISQETFSAN
ncbi:MAG: hypothetical protein KAQ90_02985, partial [Melioribacteraceae bacterium]|nr:hypothetical protein [Melioribacteraceae bacterium]